MREPNEGHLSRTAVCYLRQSTLAQVRNNQESTVRQRNLRHRAKVLGWPEERIWMIDEDLGVSGSGKERRTGFEKLSSAVMNGDVGLILYTEVSRVSRNDGDWNQLLLFCRHLDVLLADEHRIYDSNDAHDMITLGILGSVSTYELSMIRERMSAGYWQKVRRGELVGKIAPGYAWIDGGLCKHPNEEVRQAVESVFEQFDRLKTASKVQRWFQEAGLRLPTGPVKANMHDFSWKSPSYSKIITMLKNPVYTGAYVYGRSRIVEHVGEHGIVQRRQRDVCPDDWKHTIKDQHETYISWDHYMSNRGQLEENSSRSRSKGSRQVHNGSALLAGLVRCRRCGCKMRVRYHRSSTVVRYECYQGEKQRAAGHVRCLVVSSKVLDEIVAHAVCEIVQPAAVEQAVEAQKALEQCDQQQLHLMHQRLEQLHFEESLARRRFEQVDPDNRLVARNLEASWNAALEAIEHQQALIDEFSSGQQPLTSTQKRRLNNLAKRFSRVWSSPTIKDSMRKELIASLVEEVVLDHNQAGDETIALVHWKGGRHTEYRFPAGRPGKIQGPSAELAPIITSLRQIMDDKQIAATLNRARLISPLGMTWTTKRVQEFRTQHNINEFNAQEKNDNGLLTQAEAAQRLGVSAMSVFRLIERGVLPAVQLRRGLPRIIKQADLDEPAIQRALAQPQNTEDADLPLLDLMQDENHE